MLSSAQNLVPNCSFEDTLHCPTGLGDLPAADFWNKPTDGSTDLFNSCDISQLNGVPNNYFGFQAARTGNGYAGWVISYDSVDLNYREYMQVQLTSSLFSGQQYFVSAYFSMADSMPMALKNFGFALSDTLIGGNYTTPINFTPQIIYIQFATDTVNWIKMSGVYTANGSEQYLTIGYFNYNNIADTLELFYSAAFHNQAYYYVDDVCVSIDSTNCSCDSTNAIDDINFSFPIEIFPNPAHEKILLFSRIPQAKLMLFDLLGRKIVEKKIGLGKNELEVMSLSRGVYILKILYGSKIFIRKISLY